MVRVSNMLIGLLNFITLLNAISLVAIACYYKNHPTSTGQSLEFLYWPCLVLGLFMMVLSLLGLFGSCCRITFFMWIYLAVTFLLILGLSSLLVLGFIITHKGAEVAISSKGFMEYRLGKYPGWLQNQVVDSENWREIMMMLQDGKICAVSDWAERLNNPGPLWKQPSPIQSGCCKPPINCGYTFKNATYWMIPKLGHSSEDKDCNTWSNVQEKLCYNCDSCKAGILQYIKNGWKMIALYLGFFLGFLIIVYATGCCAMRNNRADKYQRYRGAYN